MTIQAAAVLPTACIQQQLSDRHRVLSRKAVECSSMRDVLSGTICAEGTSVHTQGPGELTGVARQHR